MFDSLNLLKLIQTYTLQQNLATQTILNDEMTSFEDVLNSQLNTIKEPLFNEDLLNNLNSLSESSTSASNNLQFIYSLSQLFNALTKFEQQHKPSNIIALNNTANPFLYKNSARTYFQNQITPPIPPLAGYNKSFFNQDVFLGDSITKGLSAYHVLDDSKVYAQVGIGVKKVEELVDSAAIQNPKRVFIMIGINDIGKYTPNQFASNYINLINSVKAKCPNAKIFVQSILPVSHQATENNPSLNNEHIKELNSVILQISKKENVGYINTSALVSNTNLYANDGIHYKPTFYPSWLNFLQNSTAL